MGEVPARLNGFFFLPSSAVSLALLRIIFFGTVFYLFVVNMQLDDRNSSSMQPGSFRPIGLLSALNVPLLSQQTTTAIYLLYVVGSLMALFGLFTRTGAWIAGICGLYLYAMSSSFGKVGHGNMIVLFTIFTFAMSRAGDALSVDAWLRRRRGLPEPTRSGEYTWPVRTVWVFMSLIFVATGIAKLRWGGYDWLFTPHLASTIRQHYLLPDGTAPAWPIGLWVAQHELLCIGIALVTVIVELLFPLALIHKYFRLFFPIAMFSLQFGIGFSMGIFFWTFFLCFLFWLPWEKI